MYQLYCCLTGWVFFFPWALIRGGKYSEEDAKKVMVQILSVVAYCHLQGVVHRDLKPEVIEPNLRCVASVLQIVLLSLLFLFLCSVFFACRIFSSVQRTRLLLWKPLILVSPTMSDLVRGFKCVSFWSLTLGLNRTYRSKPKSSVRFDSST